MRLEEKLRSVGLEKRQTERHLQDALLAGERLKEISNSTKLAALQKAQETDNLSREVARLIKQSFLDGNEIADLKELCDERQIEIERLNEVIAVLQRLIFS
jgi:vacuolar-type H+-ATPase catalytic subunit A/Vma1